MKKIEFVAMFYHSVSVLWYCRFYDASTKSKLSVTSDIIRVSL